MPKRSKRKLKPKTSLGLGENVEASLSYLLTWVTGIVLYLLERKSKFVRFHALQSTIAFLPLELVAAFISVLPVFGFFLSGIVSIVIVVAWIVCMIRAYQGRWFKLPLVGKIAERKIRVL